MDKLDDFTIGQIKQIQKDIKKNCTTIGEWKEYLRTHIKDKYNLTVHQTIDIASIKIPNWRFNQNIKKCVCPSFTQLNYGLKKGDCSIHPENGK